MTLEAIRYTRGHLDILDQLKLPSQTVYFNINDTADAWQAIKKMQVQYVSDKFDLFCEPHFDLLLQYDNVLSVLKYLETQINTL